MWFRSDLRLHDNEPLVEAVRACDRILPVYVFDERIFKGKTRYGFRKTGVQRARFIIESVRDLKRSLARYNVELVIKVGKPEEEVFALANKYKTKWVFCNRERTSEEVEVQDELEKRLWSIGQEMRFERGKMLLHTQDLPFPVTHTPDSQSAFKKEIEHVVKVRDPLDPVSINGLYVDEESHPPTLEDFGWQMTSDDQVFRGGETEGLLHLSKLQAGDRARISPWLCHGCFSPKQVYHHLIDSDDAPYIQIKDPLIAGLLRRDYYRLMGKKHKNYIFRAEGPGRVSNLRPTNGMKEASAWIRGETGVSTVDTAVRDLRKNGFIEHDRRILLGRYLVEEVRVDWRIGAEMFESLLLDYDPCSNYGNWNRIAEVASDSKKAVPSWRHIEDKLQTMTS